MPPNPQSTVLLFDHHTHHERCGHAVGVIEDYVRAALALGMEEIGISDHAPLYWREGDRPQPGSAMARSELGRYVEEVLRLKQAYAGRIRVLLGLETDYAEGFEDVYREIRAQYPWDYWIGSVHYCHGYHIYDRRLWGTQPDPEVVYPEYFRLVRKSAESGLFDILGHITGVMVHGDRPSTELLEREFERTAETVAGSGVAVELNSSGIRKGTGGPFPQADLFRRCRERGVRFTYGSDAHLPDEVGHARERVATLLNEAPLWRPVSR